MAHSQTSPRWSAIATLAVGIFILITIEELPIGVLPLIADDLGVTTGMAGLTVTVPGVLAGVVSLITPVMARRLDRRLVLAGSLVAVVVSCVAAIVAPNLVTLLVARLFTGIAIGLYWAVLPVVALRQAPPERAATALTGAFSGIGAALVLGIPVSAWIGHAFGWRASFAIVGAAALVVLLALLTTVQPVPVAAPVRAVELLAPLRSSGLRCALVLTLLIVMGQFITYGYINPVLQHFGHVPARHISTLLLIFGVAGLVGNFAISPLLRRSPVAAVFTVASGILVALLGLVTIVSGVPTAGVAMLVWGFFSGAVSVSIQSFVTQMAGEAEEAATAINAALYNVAIAAGAGVGGVIVDREGLGAALATSIAMLALGALTALGWRLWHGR